MKFSSISLIATALAVIAGSAIAAPSPLYARAIEQVKSFEGDLDGEPVNDLSIRSVTEHHCHSQAALHAEKAMNTNIKAADWALAAADWDAGRGEDWLKMSGAHRREANRFVSMQQHHAHRATLPHGTTDRATANRDGRDAMQSTQLAEWTIRAAKGHKPESGSS